MKLNKKIFAPKKTLAKNNDTLDIWIKEKRWKIFLNQIDWKAQNENFLSAK
jgi:hypothetical protein